MILNLTKTNCKCFRSGKRKLRSPEHPVNDRKFPKKESEKFVASAADESHSEDKTGSVRPKKLPVIVPSTAAAVVNEERQQELQHDEVDFHPATDKSSTLVESFAGNYHPLGSTWLFPSIIVAQWGSILMVWSCPIAKWSGI